MKNTKVSIYIHEFSVKHTIFPVNNKYIDINTQLNTNKKKNSAKMKCSYLLTLFAPFGVTSGVTP